MIGKIRFFIDIKHMSLNL
uniref:Uncharacterized protein n=1 Tax=Lepeophtheirus salmonis TaxID=72036 RepID=A0A0K2U1Y3_LEPSM